MRFDVSGPVAGVQPAQPFNLAQQEALDAALRAQWATNVAPLIPNPAPNRDVSKKELLWGGGTWELLGGGPHGGGTALGGTLWSTSTQEEGCTCHSLILGRLLVCSPHPAPVTALACCLGVWVMCRPTA
jgi:hypothetical protein